MDVIGGIEKIPRHIAPIDGLDHELNAVWAYRLGGPAQIADEYGFTARQRGSGWGNASHGVEADRKELAHTSRPVIGGELWHSGISMRMECARVAQHGRSTRTTTLVTCACCSF
jgi:hypothetical protein